MANAENPNLAAFIPTSVTHTEHGTATVGDIYATSEEAGAELAKHIEETYGGQNIGDSRANRSGPSTSRSIGFGGTRWNATWEPSGDKERAARAAARQEHALREGIARRPQPRPGNN